MDEDELFELGFKYSAIRILKDQLTAQHEANELQIKLNKMKENHFNLIKRLQPKETSQENIEPEFNRVILEELSLESLRKAFASSDLTKG